MSTGDDATTADGAEDIIVAAEDYYYHQYQYHEIIIPDSNPDLDFDYQDLLFDEEEDRILANSNARNDDSTTLLNPEILNYRTLHGRTYHAESGTARYWACNDEPQNRSMDIIHHFLKLLFDNEFVFAPIAGDIEAALDVGTGTGIWAIDFADRYPATEVTGTDISPIQPSWVPPNLQFEIEDCTQPWTFDPESMDYIHMRYLYGSIPDWTALYREAFNVCKPGGWVESCEASPRLQSDDDTIPENSAMAQWGPLFIEGAKEMDSTFTIVDDGLQAKCMRAVGFRDLKVVERKVPIGGWAKDKKLHEVGRYVQLALEHDIEGYMQYVAGLLGWSESKVTVYCAKLRRELRSGKHHPWFRIRIVCGRKPDGSEPPETTQQQSPAELSE